MTSLLIIIYVSFISLGLPDSVLGSAWPMMYPDLGAPLALAGYISMTVTGGTILSSLCCDKVVARLGIGRTTAFSTALTAAALMGFSISRNAVMLFVFAVPLGLGAGCVDVALNHYVALHYEARHMNWLHCFWGIGASAGPVLTSLALSFGGSWRTSYGFIAVIQLLFSAVLLLTLRLWRGSDQTAPGEAQMQSTPKRELLRRPGVLLMLGGFVLYCAAEATGGLWSTSFLHHRFGVSAERAAAASAMFYGSLTAGRLAAGFLSRRLDDDGMIRLGAALMLAGAATALAAPVPAAALAGIGLFGLGCAPVYPAMLHLTPCRFGAENSQGIIGMEMAVAYLGSTCFPPLFGSLAERVGLWLYPLYLLLLGGLLLLCTELTRCRLRGKTGA